MAFGKYPTEGGKEGGTGVGAGAMEEQEKEAEIRLAAKRCANTRSHRTRNKRRSLFFTRDPANVAGLSGRGSQDGGKQHVRCFHLRPTDRSAPIFNEQTEREGLHKEEVTITKKARERG